MSLNPGEVTGPTPVQDDHASSNYLRLVQSGLDVAGSLECDAEPLPIVEKAQFVTAAIEGGDVSNRVAGRSWNLLAELFIAQCMARSKQITDNRWERFASLGLRFDEFPDKDHIGITEADNKKIGGFHVAGLVSLVTRAEAAIAPLGPIASPATKPEYYSSSLDIALHKVVPEHRPASGNYNFRAHYNMKLIAANFIKRT